MSFVRCLRLPLAVAAVLMGAACGDPPDKEMQQARSAIESARGAGADLYAHDEFSAAEKALKSATEAVDQRDYRLALNLALDARERAQNAAQEAVTRKAAVRADASRALAVAGVALNDARTRLKAAETARVPAKLLAPARHAIADDERAVQEARTSFGQGAYGAVIESAQAITARLRAVAHDLEIQAAPPPRRRP